LGCPLEMYGFSKLQATREISHDILRTVFPKPLAAIEEELLRKERWGELRHTTREGTNILVSTQWVAFARIYDWLDETFQLVA
jgi:hypothetical protein